MKNDINGFRNLYQQHKNSVYVKLFLGITYKQDRENSGFIVSLEMRNLLRLVLRVMAKG
uniref:Uncharacterized protein n=1 Tax=Anguilla anguilla TaxID=7936 RepID=A0A0E9Q024_ANGAN